MFHLLPASIVNYTCIQIILKNINKVKAERLPIVFGGPVNTERIIALSIDKQREKQFISLQSIVLHTDIQNFVKNFIIKNNKSKFLLARGISAWDSSQLEDEIAENSWFIIQPNIYLIFSHEMKNKWSFAIEELGIKNSTYIAPYSGNA